MWDYSSVLNTAYLICKQYNAYSKGPKAQISQETRIMEKEADGWKIVNVTVIWDSKNRVGYDSVEVGEK